MSDEIETVIHSIDVRNNHSSGELIVGKFSDMEFGVVEITRIIEAKKGSHFSEFYTFDVYGEIKKGKEFLACSIPTHMAAVTRKPLDG